MTRHSAQTHPSELAAFVNEHFPERRIRPDGVIAQSWYRSVMEHRLDPTTATRLDILCADDIRRHQNTTSSTSTSPVRVSAAWPGAWCRPASRCC